jgi:hypothetical protein
MQAVLDARMVALRFPIDLGARLATADEAA